MVAGAGIAHDKNFLLFGAVLRLKSEVKIIPRSHDPVFPLIDVEIP